MEDARHITEPNQSPIHEVSGWDELNLCEFPIALLGDRATDGCLELTFQDTVWDESANQEIQRKLHVSALPKHGLPRATDEDVLRFMIYVTERDNQFTDRKVYFTHYDLIKLLGWNDGGKSYRRITDAMYRWRSTELDYQNAWRDPETKSWADATVSILADVVIFDAEKKAKHRNSNEQFDLPLSYFVWGETFFKSMQSNYRKRLDLKFIQSLKTGSSKRLYCFLDKRFGTGRNNWDFNLHEFAYEKMGMSRNYDTGKVKEKLEPAITELEGRNYLAPASKKQRFIKKGPKNWRVCFERASENRTECPIDTSLLAKELASRGISDKTAAELISKFDSAVIELQLDIFDWIIENEQAPTNPAGFLIASIRDGYKPPTKYKSKHQRMEASQIQAKRVASKKAEDEIARQEKHKLARDRQHLKDTRKKLSQIELGALEQEAIKIADEEQKKIMNDPKMRQFQIDLIVDQLILEAHSISA